MKKLDTYTSKQSFARHHSSISQISFLLRIILINNKNISSIPCKLHLFINGNIILADGAENSNESFKTRSHPSKGRILIFSRILKEVFLLRTGKSYNRRGNLRFKASNEAEKFLM